MHNEDKVTGVAGNPCPGFFRVSSLFKHRGLNKGGHPGQRMHRQLGRAGGLQTSLQSRAEGG